MKKQKQLSQTLQQAVQVYVVYLHAKKLSPQRRITQIRVLRHILKFYGYHFHLHRFSGSRVLQYADIYSPYSDDPYTRDKGRYFWLFVHWLRKNEMIPPFTAQDAD